LGIGLAYVTLRADVVARFVILRAVVGAFGPKDLLRHHSGSFAALRMTGLRSG
jgi:hypothetical protein